MHFGHTVAQLVTPSIERTILMFRKLFITICTFSFISTSANAEEIFLVCPVKGSWRNFGLSGLPTLLQGDISEEVVVSIGLHQNKPISLKVKPQTDLHNRSLFSNSPSELTVTDTFLSIHKRFVQGISSWEQSASLNRHTLLLNVQISREYIKPPSQGFLIDYSGACIPTSRKI
jgi:hypothetical protein